MSNRDERIDKTPIMSVWRGNAGWLKTGISAFYKKKPSRQKTAFRSSIEGVRMKLKALLSMALAGLFSAAVIP